uniref:Centrosomal protein 89 n=1 Tax=Poecilia latipinna TaxID=48699 RepID=A0A3B3VPK6_9TELE
MMKFNFRREKDKEFKHIAHGLIPAASIAPKAAVPRTPPPQSPDPSPERHRSALAAAILSSSLTGQTWVIPPARPRSISETDRSESFLTEPNGSSVLYSRDRWSEDLASRPHLSSPDHSEGELEDDQDAAGDQGDADEHVYQTLDRREDLRVSEMVHDLPLEAEVRKHTFAVLYNIKICFWWSYRICSQAELQSLRQHAQELVDENDALKLTVHRLNVELSRYQARFRPLSKQEVDMKYLCPLLLAYEDNMNEKEALLQTTEVKLIFITDHMPFCVFFFFFLPTFTSSSLKVQMIQQQALLVLQENQALIGQLEAQHEKAKANHSKHQSEGCWISRGLSHVLVQMEAYEDIQLILCLSSVLTSSLSLSVQIPFLLTLLHFPIVLSPLSILQCGFRLLFKILSLVNSHNHSCQSIRKAEGRMSTLRRQKEEHLLKEEKTRHYLEAVVSVAEHISRERDHLLHTASGLQQEKQGFVSRILNGTVRFGKLQEELKVYRRQASTRLAALEEAAEGKTASYKREILHLQKLLRERQEAEEKLLQSKRLACFVIYVVKLYYRRYSLDGKGSCVLVNTQDEILSLVIKPLLSLAASQFGNRFVRSL